MRKLRPTSSAADTTPATIQFQSLPNKPRIAVLIVAAGGAEGAGEIAAAVEYARRGRLGEAVELALVGIAEGDAEHRHAHRRAAATG